MFSYLISNVLSDTFRYIYRYLYFNVLVVPYQSNVKKTDIIKQATHVIFVSMYFRMFKNNRDFKTRWCFIIRYVMILSIKQNVRDLDLDLDLERGEIFVSMYSA